LLLRWLQATLTESIVNRGSYAKQTWLLFMASQYAAREPSRFVKEAADLGIEPLLAAVVRGHDWEPGRMAAIRLITRLRRIQPTTAQALQDALLDVMEVRNMAMDALANLPRLEGAIEETLFTALNDASVAVADSSARILTAQARNEQLSPDSRSRILEALVAAVRSPLAQRRIDQITGAGTGEDDHHRLTRSDRLQEHFFHALLLTSGM